MEHKMGMNWELTVEESAEQPARQEQPVQQTATVLRISAIWASAPSRPVKIRLETREKALLTAVDLVKNARMIFPVSEMTTASAISAMHKMCANLHPAMTALKMDKKLMLTAEEPARTNVKKASSV